VAIAVAATLLLGGCSEQERREQRQHEARIAAEQAKQQRMAAQYTADVIAETQRRKNVLDAETARQRTRQVTSFFKVAAALASIGGVVAFVVHSIRRLGEHTTVERTKRHAMNLKAIEADPHLSPTYRSQLYGRAIEAASHGGPPLLGPPRD
tara:strand:- start:1709 stop:2164 length:456 start_codon:yes stop_codon:yes gene_type:complete